MNGQAIGKAITTVLLRQTFLNFVFAEVLLDRIFYTIVCFNLLLGKLEEDRLLRFASSNYPPQNGTLPSLLGVSL